MIGAMNKPRDCRIPMVIMRIAAAAAISRIWLRRIPVPGAASFIDVPLYRTARYCASRACAVARFDQRACRHLHLRRLGEGGHAGGIQTEAARRATEEFPAEPA